MLASRGLAGLCAVVLVGCGSGDFQIAAEPVADTGLVATDTDIADSTAPDLDTAVDDSGAPDSLLADSAVAPDTSVAEVAVDTGPDTATPTCTPSTETCNGRDDDCNGIADDGFATTTCGVGACRKSASVCAACVPGTPAMGDTTCDGVDDDCNGVVDDGCIKCDRYVMAGGIGTGTTPATPMATIQAAINALTSGTVCVAAAGVAGICSAVTYNERVTMKEGVSVFGGFKYGTTAWTRGDPACQTAIIDIASASPVGAGVFFGPSITNATQLDGFNIRGADVTGTISAAISMQGGGRVTNNVITGGNGSISYGMQLVSSPAVTLPAPLIMFNQISTSNATSATGIRVSNLAPEIRNNRSITAGAATNNGKAIELANARGSIVVDNGTINATTGSATAGIEISGDGSNIVIARNTVAGGSGGQARGVNVFGTTPAGRISIIANTSISSAGSSSFGIDAPTTGASLVIDGNTRIIGKTGGGGAAYGIRCMGSSVNCVIANNGKIAGYESFVGGDGRGVHIANAAAATIRKNGSIVGCAAGGNACTGVQLDNAAPCDVDSNVFDMNRGSYTSGVSVRWTNATVRNNVVWVGSGAGISLDIRPSTTGTVFEALVTSNTVIAPPPPSGTVPAAHLLVVDNETMAGPPNGVFRNNLAVCLGAATNRNAFAEFGNYADPRVLENNDLFGCATLYRDHDTTSLTSIAAVAALTDIPIKANNLSVDPGIVTSDYHLASMSPLINAGTNASCPAYDIDGHARPARTTCDIGADEVP